MKKVQLLTPVSLLLRSLLLIALGVLVLAAPRLVEGSLRVVLSLALMISGALAAIGCIFRKEKRTLSNFLNAVLTLAGGVVIAAYPKAYQAGFGLLFGLWALLNGILRFIYVAQLVKTHSPGKIGHGINGLISVLFGVAMMVKPVVRSRYVHIIAGVYLLLYGLSVFVEFLVELFRWNVEQNRVLSRLRVQPPTLFTALIPYRLIKTVNNLVSQEPGDLVYVKGEAQGAGEEVLEVLFHLGPRIAYGFGHVDICYRGYAYSYGCHDDTSNRMMGLLSDGTLLIAPEKAYLDYCFDWEKKTIVGFYIRLNKAQDEKIKDALRRMVNACVPWKPTERNGDQPGSSGHISRTIPVEYRKLQSGPFKIYNAVKTNCVAMVEMLVSEAGVCLLPTAGIITPGSYYNFLERRLQDADSRVSRKVLYKTLKPVKEEKPMKAEGIEK